MRILTIFAIALILFGCTATQSQSQKPLIAVASFPIYEMSSQIAGDDFEVWLMQPPGLNAHSYEPKPQELVRLSNAQVFIYVSPHFELWAPKAGTAALSKDALAITASEPLSLIRTSNEKDPFDPHVWMSPKNAKEMTSHISNSLQKKFPDKKDSIKAREIAYLQKLEKLSSTFSASLVTCQKKQIYVSHSAFGYLARDYGLEQIPIVKSFEPSGDEVSISELKLLVDSAKANNVTHVFFEEFVSPRMSEAIASEVGATTSVLSPMEAYSNSQIQNQNLYIYVMQNNLGTLMEALDCG